MFNLSAQGTIFVPPQGPSPLSKTGWNLVFNDEFDNLNLKNWDLNHSAAQLSWAPGNYGDDQPCCHEGRISFEEPRQVISTNGICKIKLQEADAHSLCRSFQSCISLNLQDPCKFARSGEIKTFSYESDDPSFREWQIPEGSYIEMRAKVGDKNCNAWSAFWLYGGDQEIDVFETLAQNSPYDYGSGYWSDKYVNGEWIRIYDRIKNQKIVSIGFRIVRENKIEIFRRVRNRYEDKFPNVPEEDYGEIIESTIVIEDVDLSKEFVNYGVIYNSGNMKFYINGVVFFDWNLSSNGQANTTLPFVNPKTIRIGMGLHKDKCVFCPTDMDIDYLRVYTPINNRFVKWLKFPEIMNKNEAKELEVNYVPSLNYNWTFGAFNSLLWDNVLPTRWIITCPNTMQSGMKHAVSVNTLFPDQKMEILNGEIYIQGNEAPPMPIIVSSKISCFTSDELKVDVKVRGIYPNTLCSSNTGTYQWSTNSGVNFYDGTDKQIFILPNDGIEDKLQVRISNCFGYSSPLIFEIPKIACPREIVESTEQYETYKIYSLTGSLVCKIHSMNLVKQLNLPPDIYIIETEVFNNGKLINKLFQKYVIL